MKKEEIRREFFKLKIKGHTNNQCRKIILAQFGYEVCKRTLQRWNYKLNKGNWDLCDKSKRPATQNTIKKKQKTEKRKGGVKKIKFSFFCPLPSFFFFF